MMKNAILPLSVLSCLSIQAQVPLTSSANMMRHGDILCKLEVPYVNPSERGTDAVWLLPEVPDDGNEHLQAIYSNPDTIAIFEDGRILHYFVHGDTLCYKGEQSRRSYDIYSQERPFLRYPFQYGDSIPGSFSGDSRNEDDYFKVRGFGYTVADGNGVLTDGEDTLRHITRLHLFDDYIYDYGNGEICRIVQDCAMWYCAGYRYAVMESVRHSVYENGSLVPMDSITFLYMPCMQLDGLAEDEVNENLLAELEAADAARRALENGGGAGSLSSVNASLSSDGCSVTISYSLRSDTDISFYACDIMGNVLGQASYQNKEAGDWQKCLTLSRKPIGNVLMLSIRYGNKCVSIKVNK